MNEQNAVTVRDDSAESDIRTMVKAVQGRLAAVRELLQSELKGPSEKHPEGIDYGVVPGTKKLVLLQPGAEKIALMFSFVPSYDITRVDLPGGHREVHAICTLTHSGTGRIVGQCGGSSSTMETKHRYRGAAGKACPECNAMACVPSKKEYGGGYFWKEANGGCGKKWKPGTDQCKALDDMPATKQENPDPADQWNTVDKIAQKRAYVGAVKGASAASEVFTVDLEDNPEQEQKEDRPRVEMPTARTSGPTPDTTPATASPTQQTPSPPSGGNPTVTVNVGSVGMKAKKKDGSPMKDPSYYFKCESDGKYYSTFSGEIGKQMQELEGADAIIEYKDTDYGRTILSIRPAPLGNADGGVY